MIYKEMTVTDAGPVAELYRDLAVHIKDETGDEYFNFSAVPVEKIKKELISGLRDDTKRVFIVVNNKRQIVGFIAGEMRDCFLALSPIQKVGYIGAAYVVPSCRGKGIGRRLEKVMQDFFARLGIDYVELHVLSLNSSGKRAWEKLGYTTFREQMRRKLPKTFQALPRK